MAASSRLLLCSHEAVSLQENASVLLQGSIHQRDGIFSPDSRGRQCLPCCLVLFVKAVQKRICTTKLIAMTFSFNPYAVFICNGFSIALLEQGDCFYLFESHARASDGMPNVNGKNILLKKTNITGIFLTFA